MIMNFVLWCSLLAIYFYLYPLFFLFCFFFFKQKTAYEMRISDWSSDVCSSDLEPYTPFHDCEQRQRHRRRVDDHVDSGPPRVKLFDCNALGASWGTEEPQDDGRHQAGAIEPDDSTRLYWSKAP